MLIIAVDGVNATVLDRYLGDDRLHEVLCEDIRTWLKTNNHNIVRIA